MIDRQFNEYVLSCDICGEEIEDTFTTFQEAVDFKKENGWKSKFEDDEWQDICPNCRV